MALITVTDATFEKEVLRAAEPVLLCLTAPGLDEGSRRVLPILQEVAEEVAGQVKVVNADLERCPMIAQSLRVQAVPTYLLIENGQMAGQHAGVVDKQTLLRLLEPFLPAPAAAVKGPELVQLLAAKRALPVDVRDAGSFSRYRIPGAINVPADELEARAEELRPTDGRVRILYDRTQDRAKELCEALGAKGIQVGYLEGGFLHWEADGLEVERG